MISVPVRTDIALIGGGHAHVHVLKAFAMNPEPGVRLTLIARELETPYSGMLPGVVAGLYSPAEAVIDLVRLAAATRTRLIHAEAVGLDRAHKRVLLAGRAPIAYDIVSADVGITPALSAIAGAAEHGIAVKPIGQFLAKFATLLDACRLPCGPRRIAMIGGGAGGVELLLSVRTRLLAEACAAGRQGSEFSFALITADKLLAGHNHRVREAFRSALASLGVSLYEHRRVKAVSAAGIACADGETIQADAALISTEAAAPEWLCHTGLKLDDGFIAVHPTLQSLSDPDVFAAGDCAALVETPREKAGVFAVRAGPPLAANLRRHAQGRPARPWRPQRRHLALISTGQRYAVASRGRFKTEGAWVWTIKDLIDRRFMRMYQDVDRMAASMSRLEPERLTNGQAQEAMRCGGCAAKIGPGPLSRALARLPAGTANHVLVGLEVPDDAAIITPPNNGHLVLTIDFFRAFIDDPYVFGEITANHALNDVFAMGGVPLQALATAVVPSGPGAKLEEALFQMLAGARACLDREDVALVGGHSSEGHDLALGFSITGSVTPERLLRKSGLKTGDVLVLTRPLGTGILFAAAMRARAKARWIAAAIAEMRRSNRSAASVLIAHGATAMTDVTGFGLIGHLGEMLTASGAEARIGLDRVPTYEGTNALAQDGVASTLLPENLVLQRILRAKVSPATAAILFDPQTSGGLLAGLPAERAQACVAELRNSGHLHATEIGEIGRTGLSTREVGILSEGGLATE